MKTKIYLLAALLFTTACAEKDVATLDTTVSATDASAEAAIQAIGGVADEQEGSSFAAVRSERDGKWSAIAALLTPPAQAAGACARARFQACVNGVRSIDYASCSIAGSAFLLSGNVTLTYSTPACLLDSVGDSVTRTYDVTVTGPRRGRVRNFSSNKTSGVDGSSIGGGGRLTKTASGWDAEVLGRNVVGSMPNGRTLFDISVKTTSPVQISGNLARAGRVLNGGAIEVHHNLAGFKATYVPSQVQYSNNCCHPVSGSWSVTYSGSITGSASIMFNGCGNATLTRGGVASALELTYCE